MKLARRFMPSPALVISLLALFVSLGGLSWAVATGSIDSREIKDNSIRSRDVRNNEIRSKDIRNNTIGTFDIRNNQIRGRDIRNSTIRTEDVAFNTLTGADIDEATLGRVPQADQAVRAQDSATVAGVALRKLFLKLSPGTPTTEVLSGPGFSLSAGCSGVGAISVQLDGVAGASANATVEGGSTSGDVFASDRSLQPGDNLDLAGGAESAGGTAVVATSAGTVTTLAYSAHSGNAFGGEPVCAVQGTATTG